MTSDAVHEVLAVLKQRGGRITAPRRAVIEVLAINTGHLTADEVADLAQQREPRLHRATVYRTLDALGSLGLVAHTHLAGGAATYHLKAPSAPHPHVHAECTRCMRVIDIDPAMLDDVAARLLRDTGFTLVPHHAALLGLCARCAKRPDDEQ